jgi:hypothetical protein
MAAIRITSRLRHFSLLARITRITADGIGAIADLNGMPDYCGLEAMAQLAALHVRHCIDFQRHVFLLKVNRGRWRLQDKLQGCYRLSAERYSQSSHAFAYRVKGQGPGDGMLTADLLIGTRPYDHEFREDILKMHYKNIFSRLQRDG